MDAKPGRVMEGRRGQEPKTVRKLDLDARREIDLDLTAKAIDFMKRRRPPASRFSPTSAHAAALPDRAREAIRREDREWRLGGRAGPDGLVRWPTCGCGGRVEAHRRHVFIFASDNGPEDVSPWRGWAGPWSGSYVTAMEGSIRVPFVVRWPGKISLDGRATRSSTQWMCFSTLAGLGGARVPADRPIDGVDLTPFLFGRRDGSGGRGFRSTGPRICTR